MSETLLATIGLIEFAYGINPPQKMCKIVQYPCVRNPARPGSQPGLKARVSLLWLGFGRGIKKKTKNGEATATGPAWPGLAWPQLVRVKSGKAWQGKAEKFGLQLTCTGRGWPGLKIGQACLVTSASLARIKLQGLHTCSGFTLSSQSYRILSFIIDHQMYSKHILS